MRIPKLIRKKLFTWSNTKISKLIYKEMWSTLKVTDQLRFKSKTVDPTIYTNFPSHRLVICATVVQTDVEENNFT